MNLDDSLQDLIRFDGDNDAHELELGGQDLLSEAWDVLGDDDAAAFNYPELVNLSLEDNEGDGIDSITISSRTDRFSSVDLLEEKITSTRNGEARFLSTVSEFTGILARTGIHGPRHLKAFNLKARAIKVGNGTQFTVFREKSSDFQGNEGLVIKRVNVPLSREDGKVFATGAEYRRQLRSLELEVLALCNPALRNHRNIVHLVAWGYDYPLPDTPVPALFVEAALMSLTEFLRPENLDEALSYRGGENVTDVKYQLALDTVAGLEALHHLRIVHGDVKPDNVLVFKEKNDSSKVPFCAKLSDFGVCIDMETSANESSLSVEDYIGTPAWLAPEVRDKWPQGSFQPDIMLRFDAYSLGLMLLSIFTNHGKPVDLNMDGEEPLEVALYLLRNEGSIRPEIRKQLSAALRAFLAEDPWTRSLPAIDLLRTDTAAYASWLWASHSSRTKTAPHVGTIDPIYNRGPLFWYRLDPAVLSELEEQYTASKTEDATPFPGDVLFGMAQTVTGMKPAYLDRLLEYVTEAARLGFSPARAVYAQVIGAHTGHRPKFDNTTLDKWTLRAIAEGYLFAKPSERISQDDINTAKQKFRDAGGFCTDSFLQKKSIIAIARDKKKALEWQTEKDLKSVDRNGNTMLHVAASLGAIDTLKALVEESGVPVDVQNDNDETPLYKACQVGHAEVIKYLLDTGATASGSTKREHLTPLHWLFTLPENQVHEIATRLVYEGKADVNAVMMPPMEEGSGGFPQKIAMTHFPFELPLGTPFHWASFARNKPAMAILLDLDANINATYHNTDVSTTPLALTTWYGECDIVQYLLIKGADGTIKDVQNRNILHFMTYYSPDRHGSLTHYWHYWIRHGAWHEHLANMTELVRLLVDHAGVDAMEEKDKVYPGSTPIVLAATPTVWDGGAICALLSAGADVNEAKGSSGDSVLHAWASVAGPRLDYPETYLNIFRTITKHIEDIDLRNKYDEDTPLHLVASIYHPEDEVEAACDVLFLHDQEKKPANINAANRRGLTPLYIALGTDGSPARRGLYFAERGADLLCRTDDGKDIFFPVCSNQILSDQQSSRLIQRLLAHFARTRPNGRPHDEDEEEKEGSVPFCTRYRELFSQYFMRSSPNQNDGGDAAFRSLWVAVQGGREQTAQLLLDLGLDSEINRVHVDHPRLLLTVLDHALRWSERSRRLHMESLPAYKPGPARERALALNAVYDPSQGPPARAAEAYWSLPAVVKLLVGRGAKRAYELDEAVRQSADLLLNTEYIEQPGSIWDLTAMYQAGFTPEIQPNRAHWQIIYDLARYPSNWEDKTIAELHKQYEDGQWRPDIKLLQASPTSKFHTDRIIPRAIKMLATLGVTYDNEGNVNKNAV